ncbi:anti-sigma factor [Arthrobacter sp. 35W]|uniref:anti-sigma factor n=1 Tax=Arthrobacter sp. 35W TaxID=1132441 RepID=UPI0018C98821|nr:anti-sigma factor [Arthrobacter sp. 35W]
MHLLTGAYALNALNDLERAAFERLARTDEDIRSEVRELSETAALLAYGVPEQTPPPELKSSVMAAIRNTRQLPAAQVATDAAPAASAARGHRAAKPRTITMRRSVLQGLAAAAAVVAIAAAGVTGWALGQSNGRSGQDGLEQQLAAAQAKQNQFLTILGSEDAKVATQRLGNGATVMVAASAAADKAAVMVANMPSLPADKVYELWFIADGKAIPAGLMGPTVAAGPSLQLLDGGLDGASHIGITVEPSGGSVQPTTDPILLQQL